MIKILLLSGCLAHIVCGMSDCLLGFTPNGRFSLDYIKEPDKMSELFDGMSLKRLIAGILLGVLTLTIVFFSYFAICNYVGQFSVIYKNIMFVSIVVYLMSGVAHHVLTGVVEWFYVKLNRTHEAFDSVMEFFKSTAVTMYVCYFGLIVFAVTFFITVVTGATELPRWAAIFNPLLIFLILSPTKIPAKGNVAGAIMFLGLVFLM